MEDNYSTEHYLTPSGWVASTRRYFGRVQGKEVKRPQNAVETWEHEITQASMYSKEVHHRRRLWYDESIPESERKAPSRQVHTSILREDGTHRGNGASR